MDTRNELIERLRSIDKATFTVAFRGYDRIAVHDFLGVLAAYGQGLAALAGPATGGAGPAGWPPFPPVPRFPVVFRGYHRREVDDLTRALRDQLVEIG